ncbi:MAG: ATP-binding cassette domain-containing protein, partial [Deltaproteobacteria bacterium]|nr:ATP-binding cassette domain-containing protein [Deltaproteobacteria bacterium]
RLNHEVSLKNVSFSYGDHKLFDNVSMEFPSNSFTALVGVSGVGKTTIADLITGLCRPQQGEIYADELPLNSIDLRRWRRMIGYVPQDPLLLHDTVFINVTVGETGIGEPEVKSALQAAEAWEFVSAMPQGMYSDVGERGGKLSGGQRQRLAIARALVHKPRLLILDEATSALDIESEAAICRTLQKLRRELIILAISHQPTMVEAADRTYRLENGKVFLLEGI